MSQNTSGLKSLLSIPFFYDMLQTVFGVTHSEREVPKLYFKIKDNHEVLDIGCGTAPILNFMPKSVVYTGYDISSEYINLAKKKYKKRENTFFFSDKIDKNSLPGRLFDRVILNKLLHHLSDDEVIDMFTLAKSHLKGDGKVVTLDPCFIKNQRFISNWIVGHDRGENVRTPEQYTNLAEQVFSNIKTKHRHTAWLHIDTHVMECD